MCLAYEQILTDPEGLLHSVEDYIGVTPFIPPNLKRRVNARPEKSMPAAIRTYLEENFLGQKDELERLSGLTLDW